MYVCNCNGVTKREVEEAVAAGARRPKDVLAHHGCEPCCGRCLPEIAENIERDAAVRSEALVAAE
ncbi:MAG: (2Fe-2S)-binding protein [Pseudomonadota bacterium]